MKAEMILGKITSCVSLFKNNYTERRFYKIARIRRNANNAGVATIAFELKKNKSITFVGTIRIIYTAIRGLVWQVSRKVLIAGFITS